MATLPSFNMCSKVVLPALSKPKNKILALLWYNPTAKEKNEVKCRQRVEKCSKEVNPNKSLPKAAKTL